MTSEPRQPRVPMLPPAEWSSEMNAAYEIHESTHPLHRRDPSTRDEPGNLVRILARNPDLYRVWSGFSTGLHLVRKLPPRDKELSILRVAWRCQAPFEWGQHVKRALSAAITEEEIDQIRIGPDHEGWDGFERHLLHAVDELHDRGTISSDTWTGLSERYDAAQLIEFLMVAGFYHLMAFLLNSLAVPLEQDARGFDFP
jgi:4-carboxymuconolactone decarboxylase